MAVDGMWQVFELHSSSPKNDFCRIFAKSGVLVRLVNTLHNLNEAMRAGAVIAVSSTSTTTGDKPAHKSTGSNLFFISWMSPFDFFVSDNGVIMFDVLK